MQEKSSIKRNILLFLDYKRISKYKFYQDTGITRGVLDSDSGMSEDNTARFIAYYPEVNIEWLLTGQGEMLKVNNTAGRDIAIQTNESGTNIAGGMSGGVVGDVGNVGGHFLSMNGDQKLKKLLDKDSISVEFEQSVELLQQTNQSLNTRIKDLETIIASKDKIIDALQLVIDTIAKK